MMTKLLFAAGSAGAGSPGAAKGGSPAPDSDGEALHDHLIPLSCGSGGQGLTLVHVRAQLEKVQDTFMR